MIRAELDLGYKHAGVNEVVLGDIGGLLCNSPDDCILDADGDASVLSAMGNLLLDFGDNNGLSGYVGAGVGMARVSSTPTSRARSRRSRSPASVLTTTTPRLRGS